MKFIKKYHLILLYLNLTLLSCTNKIPNLKEAKYEVIWRSFQGEKIENMTGVCSRVYHCKNTKLVKIEYFDKEGNKFKTINRRINYQPSEWRFKYSNDGKILEKSAYGSDGNIFTSAWISPIERYEYNNKNQLVQFSTHDENGKLKPEGDRYDAIEKYGYNDKGQLIWTRTYTHKNEFKDDGYGLTKYFYNEKNNLSKFSYCYNDESINTYWKFYCDQDKIIKTEQYSAEDILKEIKESFRLILPARMLFTSLPFKTKPASNLSTIS